MLRHAKSHAGGGLVSSGASRAAPIAEAYDRLMAAYGPQHWWPGAHGLEVLVGAVLVQNTAWPNAARAIADLKAAGFLARGDAADASALHALGPERLAPLIRAAGTFRVKARRLHNLLDWLITRHAGDLARVGTVATVPLRAELLALSGIGPETADALCLYVFARPTFVIDAYARRVAERHGWTPATGRATYDQLQQLFTRGIARDQRIYNEYHALLVEVGKRHCRARASCAGCPLAPLLP